MRCAPGTHEAALDMLLRHGQRSGRLLDVASGSGALLARLRDHRFADLHAIELDVPKFACEGITPISVDLNSDFAASITGPFSIITAIEIIEHLDSPRHFLRQLWKLLDDRGLLVLSTPNVGDLRGRMKFLLRGELRYFDEGQYRYNHHVSPITDTMMRLMLAEVGYEIVEQRTVGSFAGPIGRRASKALSAMLRPLLGRRLDGEVNLYLARQCEPAKDIRPGDWISPAS